VVKSGYSETLTVGELRKALRGLDDKLPVQVRLPRELWGVVDDGHSHVATARYEGPSGISSPEFMIVCGKTYDY
jgi:hypothetical protein